MSLYKKKSRVGSIKMTVRANEVEQTPERLHE